VDRARLIRRLPEPYAETLRLLDSRHGEAIAERLGIEPEAVGPMIELAEAKLARLSLQLAPAADDNRRMVRARTKLESPFVSPDRARGPVGSAPTVSQQNLYLDDDAEVHQRGGIGPSLTRISTTARFESLPPVE
jgi:hypothetical protein